MTTGEGGGGGPVAAGGAAGGAPPPAEEAAGGPGYWIQMLWRAVVYYMIYRYLFSGGSKSAVDGSGVVLGPHHPLWKDRYVFEVYVFGTESQDFALPLPNDRENHPAFLLHEKNLQYSDEPANYREEIFNIPMTNHLLSNGSFWLHAFFVPYGSKDGLLVIPLLPQLVADLTRHYNFSVTKYYPPPKAKVLRSLLGGEADPFLPDLHAAKQEASSNNNANANANANANQIESGNGTESGNGNGTSPLKVAYWTPNVTLTYVIDMTEYPRDSIPPQVSPYYTFFESETCVPDNKHPSGCKQFPESDPAKAGQTMTKRLKRKDYLPVVYANDFWTLRETLWLVNDSLSELPLSISVAPQPNWKFQMTASMSYSSGMMMTIDDDELENMKRMFIETNPILLGVTFVVTILHTVFDFLAFKNDIQFWKNRKTVEGLSVRSLFVGFCFQLIIFLYLLDNETSWMILGSVFIGLFIELWKINKATIVSLQYWNGIPYPSFRDRNSYTASKTKAYDQYAMTYMSYALAPLMIGMAIYSLVNNTHKSWYSWIVSSLCSSVYTFGFINMTPQLFINYKLKSVSHLPWRVFVYKALNTFIDDLFAFIIRMPTMHRLSCFRDDIIFLIYLYQRWIYPVDMSRATPYADDETSESMTSSESTPPAIASENKKNE